MVDNKRKNVKSRYRLYSRLMALVMTLALCVGMMPESIIFADAGNAGSAVTLDLNDGNIVITPEGYTQGTTQVKYTGAYVIKGSITDADTPLKLQNETDSEVTYDITLRGVSTTPVNWATAILVDDAATAGITLNLTNIGKSSIYAYNFAAIYNGSSQPLTVNVYVQSGSLTLGNKYSSATSKVISSGSNDTLNLSYGCTVTSDGAAFDNTVNTTFVTTHTCSDNGDGTHGMAACEKCGMEAQENEVHKLSYADNGDGTHTVSCMECDYSVSENHSYDSGTSNGDGHTHSSTCSCCGAVGSIEAHTIENGTVTKEADKEEAGVYEGTCSICGELVERPIAPNGGFWIVLMDSYGDGWNGAVVSVYVSGKETSLTLDGTEEGFFVQGSADDTVALVFHKGQYDFECGIEFYAPGSSTSLYSCYDLDNTEEKEVLYSNMALADYTAVEEAIDSIPESLYIYTAKSRDNVLKAVNDVLYYLSADSQSQVDEYAQAIIDAVKKLRHSTDSDADLKETLSLTIEDDQCLIITSTGYRWNDNEEETEYVGAYSLTTRGNEANEASVLVESGIHFIVAKDLQLSCNNESAFAIEYGSRVWMYLEGDSKFTSDGDNAALNVPKTAHIHIEGGGTLDVYSDDFGAGIGGNYGSDAGHITITGGTVTATSGGAAGIGGGDGGDGGHIIITGGSVSAVSLYSGAGIGGGGGAGNGEKITITGGTVTVASEYGAGIGGGEDGSGGEINITGGMITVESEYGAGIGGGDGSSGIGGEINITGGVITTGNVGGNIIGNDNYCSEDSGENNYVIIDGATVFTDYPDNISPAPTNSDGESVTYQSFYSDREDGYASANISDGSIWLVYVKNNTISLYLPDNVTLQSTGEPDADYTEVDAAIEAAKQLDESIYMDFSEVEEAIASVIEGLYIDKQEDIDNMAKAIEDAIAALEIARTLTFSVDSDVYVLDGSGEKVTSVRIADGTRVNASEYTAYRDGYVFAGWYLDETLKEPAPDTFTISEDITLYAMLTEASKTSTSTETNTGSKETAEITKGQVYNDGDYSYRVTDTTDMTVEVTGLKDTSIKKVKIKGTVVLQGKTFKVTSIAAGAFKKNKNITSVTVNKNVVSIGANAFAGCTKLKKVTIKSKALQSIGKKAFAGDKELTRITLKTGKLKKVGKKALKGVNAKCIIKVPKKKKTAYKKIFKGKGQKKTVKIR